jgi:site-specific DNA-methyltransferase (adenine-specific)
MLTQFMNEAFPTHRIGNSMMVNADCFDWLSSIPACSIHAVVTDPPYGVKEFDTEQLQKMENGNGGIWRIPPSFDGNIRSPLPRFTALNNVEKLRIRDFFIEWSTLINKVLMPGGHVFVASNTFLSQIVFAAISEGGLEYRGMVIRQVRTLRGGDRPKNAEEEFSDVCSMPRGCYEPWGIFRKPLPANLTVSDCLRKYATGGLRRQVDGKPFEDLIQSERTSQKEREIANHPSLKPQALLRKLVYAALPLGQGVILDPFMGSGSTIAAVEAIGYSSIGIERHENYYNLAKEAVPQLTLINTNQAQLQLEF